ncbi:hypothetical protein [Clostridium sp.]|nr:hypothetical protein [Clostridium sp.]
MRVIYFDGGDFAIYFNQLNTMAINDINSKINEKDGSYELSFLYLNI